MAHEKNHDYHILPPSIWPLAGGLFAFIMLFGAVLWMHDSSMPYMFLAGLLGVLYTMFAWWSEVVREGEGGVDRGGSEKGERFETAPRRGGKG